MDVALVPVDVLGRPDLLERVDALWCLERDAPPASCAGLAKRLGLEEAEARARR